MAPSLLSSAGTLSGSEQEGGGPTGGERKAHSLVGARGRGAGRAHAWRRGQGPSHLEAQLLARQPQLNDRQRRK
eukprot:355912-Chlamydomonas_euryale.AAC.7